MSASTVRMAPDGLGAHCGSTLVACQFQGRPGVLGDQRLSRKSQFGENEVGRLPVVDGAVGVHLDAGRGSGRVELGEEQCYPGGLARGAGCPRGDQQMGGQRRGHHDRLGAGDHSIPAVANHVGGQSIPAVPIGRFTGGQCDDRVAFTQVRQDRGRPGGG